MRCQNTSPIPILTYHQIAETPAKGTPFRSLSVSPKLFLRHMRLLKCLGYRGLSMSALLPYLLGEKKGKVVGITFDDGYQNNLIHAAPILQRMGFSSTCYVVSGLLGQTNLWDAKHSVPQIALMTVSELKAWQSFGQEVGAHTHSHADLSKISASDLFEEIVVCKKELLLTCDAPLEHFCYPYGQYNAAAVDCVRQAQYRTATTTHRGRCLQGHELLELPRVPVLRRTGCVQMLLKLFTRYEDKKSQP